mmetsp:Transcript_11249/g.30700  ORF Transcript_11249/g.30700 Transcript_11249/m.30700 type:complete len:318 (+) Transcript_11249:524-1477(+)
MVKISATLNNVQGEFHHILPRAVLLDGLPCERILHPEVPVLVPLRAHELVARRHRRSVLVRAAGSGAVVDAVLRATPVPCPIVRSLVRCVQQLLQLPKHISILLHGHQANVLPIPRRNDLHLLEALVGQLRPVAASLVPTLAVGLVPVWVPILTRTTPIPECEATRHSAAVPAVQADANRPLQPRGLRPAHEGAEVNVPVLGACAARPSLLEALDGGLRTDAVPQQLELHLREMAGLIRVIEGKQLPNGFEFWLLALLEGDQAMPVAAIAGVRKLSQVPFVPSIALAAKPAGLFLCRDGFRRRRVWDQRGRWRWRRG